MLKKQTAFLVSCFFGISFKENKYGVEGLLQGCHKTVQTLQLLSNAFNTQLLLYILCLSINRRSSRNFNVFMVKTRCCNIVLSIELHWRARSGTDVETLGLKPRFHSNYLIELHQSREHSCTAPQSNTGGLYTPLSWHWALWPWWPFQSILLYWQHLFMESRLAVCVGVPGPKQPIYTIYLWIPQSTGV